MRIVRVLATTLLALAGGCGPRSAPARTAGQCPSLPEATPAGATVEVYRRVGEPEDGVTVQMVAGGCEDEEVPLIPPPRGSVTVCLDVGAKGVEEAFAALRRHDVTRLHVTESNPRETSMHRGGVIVTATWPGGRCSVANSWIWEIAPGDRPRFDALVAELGHIDGVERWRRRW